MPFSDWQDFVEGGRRLGPDSADVTVVVFSDYECPYCRVFAASLRAATEARPGLFSVVLHHYPVDATHPEARAAAIAVECAADQSRFWPMHDSLFANLEQLGTGNWTAIAHGAGVADLDRFATCLSAPEASERVQRGVDIGRRYGMRGTPSFLVNNRRVDGAAGAEYLIALLDSALASVEESR
jgi:protein-disulfide isomerase